MKLLLTCERGRLRDIYFPDPVLRALEALGALATNPGEAPLTATGLADALGGIDVCVTHWGCPRFTPEVLGGADRLRLIVHAAGSVADLVTPAVYERGIRVCSANAIMARHVAEGVLTDMLAALRYLPHQAAALRAGRLWEQKVVESRSLFGARVALVGLGTVGRYLLDLMAPFEVQVRVFDPYLPAGALAAHPRVERCTRLADLFAWGDVISVHASLTPETRGMVTRQLLELIRKDALFVNTARAAIVDEAALIDLLAQRRFDAVLDVFHQEPLPLESPLRSLDNVVLQPHVAGITAREEMSWAMIEEIGRFARGESLAYEIPYGTYARMTTEQ